MMKSINNRILLFIIITVINILILAGCSNDSLILQINLKEQLCTDEILDLYYDDGTVTTSSVESFNILSSRTTDDNDTSEVEMVLSDGMIQRTLYITARSTKYKQGWIIDSYSITDISYELIGNIDQSFIETNLSEDNEVVFEYGNNGFMNNRYVYGVESGFHNISLTNSSIMGDAYYADYSISDSCLYADITGTISVKVVVRAYLGRDNLCHATRSFSIESVNVNTNWHNVCGTYRLSIPDHQNQEQYISIDQDFNVYGYRECIGAVDYETHRIDLAGTVTEENYSSLVVSVMDPGDYYAYIDYYYEYIVITPNNISCQYLSEYGWSNYDDFIFERISVDDDYSYQSNYNLTSTGDESNAQIPIPDDYYIAQSYSFSEDGLMGEFTVFSIDTYNSDYVNSFELGDILPNGDTLDDYYNTFDLQSNGQYYLMHFCSYPETTPMGDYELSISPNVVIYDNVFPFTSSGIVLDEYSEQIATIQDFETLLNDNNTYSIPDLYIHITNGEIDTIVINPYCHEGWRW